MEGSSFDRREFLLRSSGLLATTSLAGLAFSCGGEADEAEPAAGTGEAGVPGPETSDVSLRLDWVKQGYHAPLFLALERGFWVEEGLEVEVLEGSGSADAVKAVLSGQDHFAHTDRTTQAISVSQGADVLAVCGLNNVGGLAFASPKESSILEPGDLVGKTVLTTLGGSDGSLLPGFLEANDLEGEVRVRGVAPEAKAALLKEGKADSITVVSFGVGATIAADIPVDIMLWADHGLNVIGYGIVVTADFRRDNPETIRRFVAGTVRGFEAALADREGALTLYMNRFPDENEEVARGQLNGYLDQMASPNTEGRPLAYQAPEDWSATLDALLAAGMIEEARPIEDYFTNDFAAEA